MISNIKHEQNTHLKDHCLVHDKECRRAHNVSIYLNITQMIYTLQHNQDEQILHILNRTGVEYLHIQYEQLFNGESIYEWKKILQFLGHDRNIMWKDIVKEFPLVRTGWRRKDTVKNWKNVEKSLIKNGFGELLSGDI